MREWLEGIAGPAYATAMLWTLAALVLLLVVLLLIKIVRSLTFGTFVAGGRQRKTRLAVMDAAAVDSHRRLVLVRRDDVEHLILIGGPTDVVVEQNIRLSNTVRRPASAEPVQEPVAAPPAEAAAAHVAQTQSPPPPAKPSTPAPQMTTQRPAIAPVANTGTSEAVRPSQTPVAPSRPATPQPPRPVSPAPAPEKPVQAQAAPAPRPISSVPQPPKPVSPPARPSNIDEDLRAELEHTLATPQRKEPELPASVEDEMSRLLGELSGTKR